VSRYIAYHPEQDWPLPPSIVEELGDGHLAMLLHRAVERLDLRQFETAYSEDGRPAYPPQLMLKVWLYAYAQASPHRADWNSASAKTWTTACWLGI
jgi:transposase